MANGEWTMARYANRHLAVAICHLPFAIDHWPFAILADLSSTRRSMRIYHLSGDLRGAIIYPAIYAAIHLALGAHTRLPMPTCPCPTWHWEMVTSKWALTNWAYLMYVGKE